MQNGLAGAANAQGAAKGVLGSSSSESRRFTVWSLELLAPKCRHPPSERQLTVHRKTERTRAALRRFPATSWHRSLRGHAGSAGPDARQAVEQSTRKQCEQPDGLESASQQYLQEKTDSAPQQGVPGAPESRGGPTQPTQGPPPKARRWNGCQYYDRSQATLGSWKRDASMATAAGDRDKAYLAEHD